VQVSRVDLDGRKIDFRLVREGEELMMRALKDKGVTGGPAGKAARKRPSKAAGAEAGSSLGALKAAVKTAASRGKGRKSRR
jgi:ribonuclease R